MKKILLLTLLFFTPIAQAQDESMQMDMSSPEHMHHMMKGFYGEYSMYREGSGTSWVPESSPMNFIHWMPNDWMIMIEGNANFVFDHQGGDRGDRKSFSESMFMMMATHPLAGGRIGFRTMATLEPLMGKDGYPLIFQNGETADGVNPLIDRQHPHDLFMELAATYSHPTTENASVFAYVGYPGEPALGPPTFMHRFSGMINPEAPIVHHWMDSTHVTFGVATLGYIWRQFKLEGSIFTGREPDEDRWNFDKAKFDSYSWRFTANPTDRWSFQVSQGFLESSEQLEPDVIQRRATASTMYNLPFGNHNWQTTFAWGQDRNHPGKKLNAYLLESSLWLNHAHSIFGRAERVEKDELFETGPLVGQVFTINKFSLGYAYDLQMADHLKFGMGAMGSAYIFPKTLDTSYGEHPLSFMLFGRVMLN